MKSRLRRLAVFSLKVSAVILCAELLVSSVRACEYTHTYGDYHDWIWSWAPGHDVQVFVDDRYNPTDQQQLLRGVFNWNNWKFD